MNLTIPGLTEVLDATKNMPEQFVELRDRLDTVIDLLTETNDILRDQRNIQSQEIR